MAPMCLQVDARLTRSFFSRWENTSSQSSTGIFLWARCGSSVGVDVDVGVAVGGRIAARKMRETSYIEVRDI